MTEKRYNIEYDGNCYKCIVDCEKKVLYTDRKQIVKLLNEQHETITEQASQIDFLKDENKHMRNVLNENKQLKQTCQRVEDTYHALQKKFHNWDIALDKCRNENKQLKQRNNRQAKQLDRLYNLIEEKDWRTLSDILDDFKRCEEQLQKEWGTYGDLE